MSEEAAAAIDADAAKDKSTRGKPDKHRSNGKAETNGYHDMDGAGDGAVNGEAEKEVDASQVAQKVC